jgi:hypothetical protein
MKNLFLLIILIPSSIIANIDLRVILISNEAKDGSTGTMVLEMQAKSDAGDEAIGQFRAKFLDDGALNDLSPVGVFSDQLFTDPDYSVIEMLNRGSGPSASLYDNVQYLFKSGVNEIISGSEWTRIYIISIDYNLSAGGTTTFQWSSIGKDFNIENPSYTDISGNLGDLPANVPLDPSPMPVELTSFSATAKGNNVKLNWETATEVNNYGFEIQRQNSSLSNLNSEWENIGFVKGHGNSNSVKYYSFTDDRITLAGWYLYRLKQIDNDGTFEYSDIVEVNLAAPGHFELSQNYPNPFNPSTTITYSLRNAGNVRLIVYNLQGQVVKELVNEYEKPGFYSISFNGDQLASGIYYYKLISEDYQEIKKMMLLK